MPSPTEMVRKLLEQPYKLVLVQQHELERLRNLKNKLKHTDYITNLYDHYIVKQLPKTYINNH